MAAACHTDATVACLAVAHLRMLAGRLLSQGELPHYMHQARPPTRTSNNTRMVRDKQEPWLVLYIGMGLG